CNDCTTISRLTLLTLSFPTRQTLRRVSHSASPSPSAPATAKTQPSRASSSMKSKLASMTMSPEALQAADAAFTHQPSLSLDGAVTANAKDQVGRRRLAGGFFIEIDRIQPDPAQPRRNLA